jgi:glycerol-3-phosphate acyltransferase PlsX
LTRTPTRKLGAFLAKGAFRTIRKRLDPDAYGGAPLLGLNGNVMIAHGSAQEYAIMNAIRMATEAVAQKVTQIISEEIRRARAELEAESAPLLVEAKP